MGTKSDLVKADENLRQVQEEDAREECEEKHLEYVREISSKNMNQKELLEIMKELVEKVHERRKNKK